MSAPRFDTWEDPDEAIETAKWVARDSQRTTYVVRARWVEGQPFHLIINGWGDHLDRWEVHKDGTVIEWKDGQPLPPPPSEEQQAVARVRAFLAAHDADRVRPMEYLAEASVPLPEQRREGFTDYEIHRLTRADLDTLLAIVQRLEES